MTILNETELWRGWSLGLPGAVLIDNALKRRRPSYVLEAGSGVSTVVFAEYAKRFRRNATVISLEADAEYFGVTKDLLRDRNLTDRVDLRLVPLTARLPFGPGASIGRTLWYETKDLPPNIDFALIDGPAGHISEGRVAALPALWDLLAPDFELWLDDAGRMREKVTLRHWARLWGVTVELFDAGHKQMARVTRS